jgi:hypothetical protein
MRTVAALVAALGLFVTVQRLGIAASATLYVLSAMPIAALAAALQRDDTPAIWRAALRPGLVGGAVALATFGMVLLFGPGALLVLLAAVAFSPPVLRWFRHRHDDGERYVRTPGSPGPTPASDSASGFDSPAWTTLPKADDPTSKPESMSDADLCREWRRSYGVLQRSGSVPARLLVVQQRQRYLDELERRNPSGLSVWLSSGARAAGDPSRYIVQRSGRATRRPFEPPAA